MAANPSKPPGLCLNQSSNGTNNNNNSSSNENITPTTSVLNNNNTNIKNNNNNSGVTNINNDELLANNIETTPKPKNNCNCTNISIMHLFHEMKQEFPTIPDTIVAQCVNENCHQRENCIQMLRNELALNPIPVQSYPAKVLRQQQLQQRQQQQLQKPPTPLKPIRIAPLQPQLNANLNSNSPQLSPKPNINTNSSIQCATPNLNSSQLNYNPSLNSNTNSPQSSPKPNRNLNSLQSNLNPFSSNLLKNTPNCDSVELLSYKNLNNLKDVTSSNTTTTTTNTSDMPTTTTVTSVSAIEQSTAACQNLIPIQSVVNGTAALLVSNSVQYAAQPRARPTTLNLQTQQQRQQLNVQLQQHLQQRNHQQQQKQQQQLQKPLRKAPLPPLPPKPSTLHHLQQQQQYNAFNANSPQLSHNQHSNNNNYALSQQNSFSNESSCLTSPLSSGGESEISVNVSLSSPTTNQIHNQPLLKSPLRHRSVINVQPEPPYTRDFLGSSPTTPTTTTSNGSQKSFTSVNLTLRQPNTAVPQSTIDISAGPGLPVGTGGSGSGLTYSSTSFDARRGFQKNFHITVTDEGGVFSASRIRPRERVAYTTGEHEQDSGGGGGDSDAVAPIRSADSEQNISQQQQYSPSYQPQQQYTVANYNNSTEHYGDMCLPRKSDGFSEILERQKARRDKLATALRDNKKRYGQVEQEINMLTEPIKADESERLDSEIKRLRCDCEAMLNEIENARRCGPSILNNTVQNSRQQTQQQQQQSFPRQRPPRPPPPNSVVTTTRQPQLDFVQHHSSNTTTPTSPSLQQQYENPPTYQQYYQQYQQQQQPHTPHGVVDDEDEEFSDSNTEGGDDDEDEPLEMWACNMCTFRNHPQLNICECCDNVRILPGTIRIIPNAAANAPVAANTSANNAAASTNVNATSLENDANLTQQQLQHFALHT